MPNEGQVHSNFSDKMASPPNSQKYRGQTDMQSGMMMSRHSSQASGALASPQVMLPPGVSRGNHEPVTLTIQSPQPR